MKIINLAAEVISDETVHSAKILLESGELQPEDVYQDLQGFSSTMAAHPESIRFATPIADLPQEIKLDNDFSDDKANSKLIYASLVNLTPLQACDESLWFTLTLQLFDEYVSKRWPLPTASAEPENRNKQLSHLKEHLFVNSGRGLRRNQAISRLWFMGYVANNLNMDPDKALDALFFNAEIVSSFMDRVSITQIPNVGKYILETLHEKHIQGSLQHVREKHRAFLKDLDLLSARHAFAFLPETKTKEIVAQAFETAYSD